ncbi:MAG: adenosylcobinamide-phosphate synthase CbiB [Lachnospiraceae bacterium]|nr:adenosylcobinamide-phosphate synthase CbiB [Lachnospiraceae bacterium]
MLFNILIFSYIMAFIADLILGDPDSDSPLLKLHPVLLMGKLIASLEKLYRRLIKNERLAGTLMTISVLLITLFIPLSIYVLLLTVNKRPAFIALILLEIIWGYQSIAVKSMLKESMNVYEKLLLYEKNDDREEDLKAAREAVGRIVGRETKNLSQRGIIKACVETVAEGFCDGVVAPMFYYALLGAPGALLYKAVNTMDSMVGYKNERYIDFGRSSAKLDDVFNFIPSRLAALFIILVSSPSEGGMKNAFRIWKRDRRNHESPNSAQTESAMAGALNIELGGGAVYFGKYCEKPTIGDDNKEILPSDILSANSVFLSASFLSLLFGLMLRALALSLFLCMI